MQAWIAFTQGSWDTTVRAGLYFAGLMYCFMGVAIVADVFMSAIEKITSKTRKVLSQIIGKIMYFATFPVMIHH
jgi:hypothetical protein